MNGMLNHKKRLDHILSSTFGDYLSNKNPERQTDGQTNGNGRPISSYCRCHERSRKRKVESRPTDYTVHMFFRKFGRLRKKLKADSYTPRIEVNCCNYNSINQININSLK